GSGPATLVRLEAPSTARQAHIRTSCARVCHAWIHEWEQRLHALPVADRIPSGAACFEGKLFASSTRCALGSNARGHVGREVTTRGPRADRARLSLPQGAQRAPEPGE